MTRVAEPAVGGGGAGVVPGRRSDVVGRDVQVHRIHAWVTSLLSEGAALTIVGEAGIGKTALLDLAADVAASAGVRVLAVRGAQVSGRVDLAGLDALLAPVRHRIVELPPYDAAALTVALGLRDGPAPSDLQIYSATLTLLRHVAASEPVAVVVDDAHRLDAGSAAALSFVARRVSGAPIGVLTTKRIGPPHAGADPAVPELELGPLDEEAATLLVARRCPSLPARVAQQLVSDAAGNPLALTELPGLLSEAERSGHADLPSAWPTGARLTSMFAGRIAALSAGGRHALIVAALNDTVSARREFAGRPSRHALDPVGLLGEPEAAGLLTADGRYAGVTFRHPLVASVVVGMSTELERRRAHRTIARAATAGSVAQVWHLAQASVGPDEDLARDLERAARWSLTHGDGRGAALAVARAAELSPAPADRRHRLAAAAYLRADLTGELGHASSLLRQAADPAPAPPRTPLSVALARAYVLLKGDGDIAGAHTILVDALTAAQPSDADPDGASWERGEALHTLLLTCFFQGVPARWTPFLAALAEMGGHAPRTLRLCADALGDPVHRAARALPDLDAQVAALHQQGDPSTVIRTAMAAVYVDRSAGCREALTRVAAGGGSGGATALAIDAVIMLGFDAFAAGDWPAAQRSFQDGVEHSDELGYRLLGWPARFGLALLAAARGDVATVAALTADMSSWAAQRSARQVQIYADHARALSALGAGDAATALRHLTSINPPGQFAPMTAHALWIMLDTVEAAVTAGRPDLAQAHVAAMRAATIADLSPRYAMVVCAAEALVSPAARATTLFQAALSVPGADRWPFDWARTQLLYGEHLHRQRDTAAAGRHLRAAYEAFARLGADPWVRRAAATLRATGEQWPALRRSQHIVRLTPHELRIANLAAVGLTNKQIAARCRTSHRSVGSVLSRVFRALAITSRAALAEALASNDVRIAE